MESKLEIEEKTIVAPGDLIASGDDYLPGNGTYKENREVRSKILGSLRIKRDNLISVVPLSGQYMPSQGDGIIGKVVDVNVSSWMVDMGSPYIGFLSLSEGTQEFVDLQKSDLTQFFDVGDVVYSKIINVTKRKDIKLSMKDRVCRKLKGGNIVKITPAKVPRLIGTGGSMIEMIKEKTGCHIIVGQNGLVWISGDDYSRASEAIQMIEQESHTTGLTDKVSKKLGDNNGKKDGKTD